MVKTQDRLLGHEDVSLLERCPHFRGCNVQASTESGPEDMSLLERCPHFRGCCYSPHRLLFFTRLPNSWTVSRATPSSPDHTVRLKVIFSSKKTHSQSPEDVSLPNTDSRERLT